MANTFDSIAQLTTDSMNEIDDGPMKTVRRSEARKTIRKKKVVAEQQKGIDPKSPTVYLLPEEKVFLNRLKAFIMLETGEKISDHVLVMEALQDYAVKNYKGFKHEL